jgi:hypothetical protein
MGKNVGGQKDFDDDDDVRDVFWPDFDGLPGETPTVFRLRFAFECAGYEAIRIEEPQTHPVVIVRATQPESGRITDQRLLFRHVREILCQAGFRLKSDELTVALSGRRILIAFQTGKWVPNYEEILGEMEEDLVG